MKNKIKSILGILFVVIIFIVISLLSVQYEDQLKSLLDLGIWGLIIYLLITIFATVVAPVSALPLLPVAVLLWGWKLAALITILGWTLGSILAFYLARRYGIKLVKRIINLEKIHKYEKLIPTSQIFLSIIWMRIFLPVDVLSYLLGLFSKISLPLYSLATLIGVTPFAIIMSYAGSLPFTQQVIFFTIGVILLIPNFYIIWRKIEKSIH